MYALSFLERRKVRGQIMANMWMVPQGRVHICVSGRNFVAVKAWLECQSIARSLLVHSSQALSSLSACNEKGCNEARFPWEGTFLDFLMPPHLPIQDLPSFPVANWKSSASCSWFPNNHGAIVRWSGSLLYSMFLLWLLNEDMNSSIKVIRWY